MTAIHVIFWISISVLIYTYVGYPLYVFIRAKLSRNIVKKDMSYRPFVSIVMSVYNEERTVAAKVLNLLDSRYPADKMEILIGSDGSSDGTEEVLKNISSERVHTYSFDSRRGKTSVLNDLVPKAKGRIVIFCDARQVFDRDAVANLAANFSDRSVGCVSGELVFTADEGYTGVSEGVGLYWKYETLIRKYESAVHSMPGATGAIYAIRKKFFKQLPVNTILDDVYIPLAIASKGLRCIWDSEAKAYDKPAYTPKEEYRRKVRTLSGNYQIFNMFGSLLNPFRRAVSMPLFSHKFLRVVAPFLMIIVFICNIYMAHTYIYTSLMAGQVAFYTTAMMGSAISKNKRSGMFSKVVSAIYMFCLMNFTALAGFYRFVFDRQSVAWEK